MIIFSVIFLRSLVLLKWLFQSIGVGLSLFVLASSRDAELMAIASVLLIVFPEVIMGSILWIFRGAFSVYEKEDFKKISVFGSSALLFSNFHYVASLSGLGLSIGLFIGIPILFGGIILISCLFFLDKIKVLTNSYLQIYC